MPKTITAVLANVYLFDCTTRRREESASLGLRNQREERKRKRGQEVASRFTYQDVGLHALQSLPHDVDTRAVVRVHDRVAVCEVVDYAAHEAAGALGRCVDRH